MKEVDFFAAEKERGWFIRGLDGLSLLICSVCPSPIFYLVKPYPAVNGFHFLSRQCDIVLPIHEDLPVFINTLSKKFPDLIEKELVSIICLCLSFSDLLAPFGVLGFDSKWPELKPIHDPQSCTLSPAKNGVEAIVCFPLWRALSLQHPLSSALLSSFLLLEPPGYNFLVPLIQISVLGKKSISAICVCWSAWVGIFSSNSIPIQIP